MTRIMRVAGVAVIAALGLPGLASAQRPEGHPSSALSSTAPAPPQEFATDDPSFYEPPNPIPAGAHGDLVRFQVAEDGAGGRRYRIMYLSETVGGAPTVVTGLVGVPGVWPPVGGFPLILDGHGSSGLADRCAPSQLLDDNSRPHGFDSYGGAISSGFVVASTDYEGLGGPGIHPFLVGLSSGRSMLDAGLAARQIPGVYVGDATGIVGFSEGGHAALWAAQLAAEWTPSQQILGSVIAAPASEVVALAHDGVGSNQFESGTLGIVAGLAAAYPEADAALDSVVTSTGRELLTAWTESACFFEEVPLSPGRFMAADPTEVEPFASLIAANTAGTVATPAPMLLIHGTEDQRVPFAHNEALLARLCAAGQVVQNLVLPAADAPAEFAHDYAQYEATSTGIEWLTGLAEGGSPISSCGG